MSDYYPAGGMKGSGIDSGDFEYGTFTCSDTDCLHDNLDATAYYDDWSNWTVECEECGKVHDKGRLGVPDED